MAERAHSSYGATTSWWLVLALSIYPSSHLAAQTWQAPSSRPSGVRQTAGRFKLDGPKIKPTQLLWREIKRNSRRATLALMQLIGLR